MFPPHVAVCANIVDVYGTSGKFLDNCSKVEPKGVEEKKFQNFKDFLFVFFFFFFGFSGAIRSNFTF